MTLFSSPFCPEIRGAVCRWIWNFSSPCLSLASLGILNSWFFSACPSCHLDHLIFVASDCHLRHLDCVCALPEDVGRPPHGDGRHGRSQRGCCPPSDGQAKHPLPKGSVCDPWPRGWTEGLRFWVGCELRRQRCWEPEQCGPLSSPPPVSLYHHPNCERMTTIKWLVGWQKKQHLPEAVTRQFTPEASE
jgi:hypothetical protein